VITKEIKLLNHQFELLADTHHKILALVGGYGNGKTYAATRKAIQLCYLNAGEVGIVTEPNYPMLRDIFIPEMKTALEEWGIVYKFNAADSIFFLTIDGKETKIICKSMENYERLVGINAAWIVCDEFDTSKPELAYKAYQKLLGRLRAGNVRQFVITTTPEGFRATYRIFETEKDESKRLIKAKTTDNKYLPPDFIDTLRAQYPENLLRAYIDGEFVNLTSGSVYSYFNRSTHHKSETIQPSETLYIGQDFNYSACISVVLVKRGDFLIAVDEIVSKDTKGVVENIKARYKSNYICVYPDASGANHKTSASDTDISILQKSGFGVYVNNSNPRVRDRVNIVNNAFEKNQLFVDTTKCPKLTEALEQQAYDPKTGEPQKGNEHPEPSDYNDALGYCLAYLKPITTQSTVKKFHRY